MRQNRWIGANEREENHLTFCVCRPHQTTRRPSLAVFFSSKSSNGNCLQHIKTRERESGRQQKTNNGRENKIITKHFLSFYYLAAFQLWIIIAFLLLFFSFINSVNKERNFFFSIPISVSFFSFREIYIFASAEWWKWAGWITIARITLPPFQSVERIEQIAPSLISNVYTHTHAHFVWRCEEKGKNHFSSSLSFLF
jgi:hypothetical protein